MGSDAFASGWKGPRCGLDGFNASFFRAYWGIIKKEVIEAVQFFFASSTMPHSWKKTLVVLLNSSVASKPASTTADFRPISVCTFIYKICTKLLSRRLRPILPRWPGTRWFCCGKAHW